MQLWQSQRKNILTHSLSMQMGEMLLDQRNLQIFQIARKPILTRTTQEKQIFMSALRGVKFFREQFDDHFEDLLEEVCEYARPIFRVKDDIVIKQDSFGDMFYIMVKGEVRIQRIQKRTRNSAQLDVQVVQENQEILKKQRVVVLGHLTDGDCFGELALLFHRPRAATIVCETNCFFITLDKQSFDRIVATKAKRAHIHLLQKLQQNSILHELSKNTIKALFFSMERRVYNYGDIVYRVGEESDKIYFIMEGEFKLSKAIFGEPESPPLIMLQLQTRVLFELKVVGVNECFGLDEFMSLEKRDQQCQCTSQEGVVYVLDRIEYKQLEIRYADSCNIMKTIAVEKHQYYAELTEKIIQTKKSIHTPSNKVSDVSQIAHLNNVKQIIKSDEEMAFITKDVAVLNENKDILVKFSTFSKNSEQVSIQSPNYRTLILNNPVSLKKKLHTHTRCLSAVNLQTKMTVETLKDQKVVRGISDKKDRTQERISDYLQLSAEKILMMAKDEMERKEKGTIIVAPRVYRQKPVKELFKRIQTASTRNTHCSDDHFMTQPKAKILHQFQSSTNQQQAFIPIKFKEELIHSQSSQMGLTRYRRKLSGNMEKLQLPLKYFSTQLNFSASNSNRWVPRYKNY